jgi:hypothetical protein
MVKSFIKAKHWQIFIVAFAFPFLLQVLSAPLLIASNNPTLILRIMPVSMFLIIVGFFGWLWSVAIGLQPKVPAGVRLNVNRFRMFFFFPLVYFILFLVFILFGISSLIESGQEPDPGTIGLIVAIILPVHFFMVFCLFYCLYFVAKTFKTVELQTEVTLSDFAGEFFLFWFYPIGVWILQPKINKMAEG